MRILLALLFFAGLVVIVCAAVWWGAQLMQPPPPCTLANAGHCTMPTAVPELPTCDPTSQSTEPCTPPTPTDEATP